MLNIDKFEPTENTASSAKNVNIDEILEDVNALLRKIARKNLPRSIIHRDVEDLEADELAQRSLIKLWLVMQKETITHHRAYARRIISSDCIDMVRRYKPVSRLPLNEHGELAQGQILFAINESTGDPARQVEQQDRLTRYIRDVVDGVLELPSQQQHAMICELKDEVADLQPIVEAFFERGVDIRKINWARDKRKLHSQRVSLAIARKKMCAAKQRYSL